MRTMVLTLAVCLAAATLPAAEPPPIGARVRARSLDGITIEGTLATVGAADLTILVAERDRATSVSFDRLERLQIADGRDRGAGFFSGLLTGLLVAVGLGLLTGFQGDHCGDGGGEECPAYGYAAGLITVPLGIVLGTALAPPRWRDVQLAAPARPSARGLRFQVAPVRGGARVALGYAF